MKIKIPSFYDVRVLVVGDVMLDSYWRGDTSRVSPEAPVQIVQVKQLEDRAGGAANVALNVKALGAQVAIIGFIGKDNPGHSLREILNKHQIDDYLIETSNLPTVNKLRVISHNQQLIRLDFEEGFSNGDFSLFFDHYKSQIKSADIVILSDYGKGSLFHVQELIKIARVANVPILVDPKSKDFDIYRGATLIKPNLSEFQAIVGQCDSDDDLARKGLELINKLELEGLVVTKSGKGMSLIIKDGTAMHIPARTREVYDVTGAGDTTIATLATALASGLEFPESVILANAAGGVVVRKLGTSTVSLSELRRAMQRQQDPWAAVLTEDELLQQVKESKAQGEKIVITNGCFDILHSGHVIYLEKAKALGQRLIIAVNDDESVRRLKGANRPVNSLQQRMLVLASLRSVDWVVPFSEDTPARLIEAISPDVLVKGGDYKASQIAGADYVLNVGGEVKIIPFEEGFSTTNMINKIKETS